MARCLIKFIRCSGVSRISARGSGPIRKGRGGGGGGGVAVGFRPDKKSGGAVGLSVSGPIRKVGGGGGYDCVSGGPGYSTVVDFMRTGINRHAQRKRAAIIIKHGPKSYEFIYGRTYGRGGGRGGGC